MALGTVVGQNRDSVLVRVDRIEGDIPGLSIGDSREVTLEGGQALADGKQLFIGYPGQLVDGGVSLQHLGSLLSIDGGAVTCAYNSQTAGRPVSVDTAIDAFLAKSGCVDVLASDDSAWNQKYCDGPGLERPETRPPGEAAEESGCGITVLGGGALVGAELTTLGLLAAVLLYRRQRR